MEKKRLVGCAGISICCTVIFFLTYYGGLFYKPSLYIALATVLNTILLVGKGFDSWAVKYCIHAVLVLIFSIIFGKLSMYKTVGRMLGVAVDSRQWGESLMTNNCIWFGILFATALFSLGVTAVTVYIIQNKE